MTQLSRVEPGFYAENSEYYFNLETFQHKEMVFWTVKHGQKLPPSFRSKREPKYLIFVGEENGRITLRNPDSGDECWAPVSAFCDSEPIYFKLAKRERQKEEPILWSLLPAWIQFDLEPETWGSAVLIPTSGHLAAGISCMKFEESAHDKLEACLNYLDRHNFDGSGIERPDHSYFLSCMTGGRHMRVRFKTESDESGGITVVDTLDSPSLYLNYSAPGTELPRNSP